MVDATHTSFVADERSYFSLIKKDVHRFAVLKGFQSDQLNAIDLIISELTSNLHKHSTGAAEILISYAGDEQQEYLEIISLDSGPGIADTKKVMADGYSTASTLGHGFGTIRRLSDFFEIYSIPRWGTIVLARVNKNAAVTRKKIVFSPLVIAKPGEVRSGDGCTLLQSPAGFRILVADGLGHGPQANDAVNASAEAFANCSSDSASEVARVMHAQIKKTRGVVATILLFNHERKTWNICGIGNIATRLWGGLSTKNYVPYNGIIGHNIPNTLTDTILDKEEYNQFIACSDGIKSRWDLQKFPFIHKYDPSILCAALYKEYARRTDDMSVIFCKLK